MYSLQVVRYKIIQLFDNKQRFYSYANNIDKEPINLFIQFMFFLKLINFVVK